MPFYRSIYPNEYTSILIWKIEESYEELMTGIALRDASRERLLDMRSVLHQKAFLSVRQLLKSVGYSDFDLFYSSHGKPFLSDGNYISVTHSHNFAAVIISQQEAGIDIEKNRPKIVTIQDKFVNTEVDSLSDEDIVKQLTVVWGAKEAMYKIYPFSGMSFKKHIAIDPFLFAERKSSGRVIFGDWVKQYDIFFDFLHEDYTLVYALPKKE